VGELVGTEQGGRDGITSTQDAAGSALLSVCRELVMKPALFAPGLYVSICTHTHTRTHAHAHTHTHTHPHTPRYIYTHAYGQIWL